MITGASKGIGLAVAKLAAQHGLDLAICARNEETLMEVKKRLSSEYQCKVLAVPTDMSKKAEVLRFAESVLSEGKPIGMLVNNAGVFMPGQIHSEEDGVLESQIETNLYSAYHLSRALIPQFIKQSSGHIFNMCSIASIMAYPNGGSYSISKFALLGMSKVLREELKDKGIKVTAILPGATFTASWSGAGIPEERFARAEDVASAVMNAYQMPAASVVEEILIRPQLGDL